MNNSTIKRFDVMEAIHKRASEGLIDITTAWALQ